MEAQRFGPGSGVALEYGILVALDARNDRCSGVVASGLVDGFNYKTVWQALGRLQIKGYISKDRFDVCAITEEGKEWLKQLQSTGTEVQLQVHLAIHAWGANPQSIPPEVMRAIQEHAQKRGLLPLRS